jgi:hypothetical protein
MTSKMPGQNISEVEVSHINSRGLWVCVADKEYFLPYTEYPWFKDATVAQITNIQLLHGHHLHWPELDVDLEIDSLKDPQKYPLKYK